MTASERIYLDSASTTKPEAEVIEAMVPYLSENFGNASSLHAFGKKAKVMLEDTRDRIAGYMGVSSSEIFFTSGGTESNNFSIKGIAFSRLGTGKKHIISSKAEHSAVIDVLKYLEMRFGFEVTYLNPVAGGAVDPEEFSSAITDKTFLAVLMHSNNETGAITDIDSVAGICAERGIFLHCDTVQSFGKVPVELKNPGISSAALSAHKIYGPKGISALYVKRGTSPDKFIHGGMQERDMRGGTENIPAVAGFGKAVEILQSRQAVDMELYSRLRKKLLGTLQSEFGNAIAINSPLQEKSALPNILNISFDRNIVEFDEEMLLIMLDLKGIAVSGGSACTSGTSKPSHVLLALGKDPVEALGSIRVSFGRENTESDISRFVSALKEIVKIK